MLLDIDIRTYGSIVDLLQEVLELIIPSGSPIVDTAVYEVVAEWLHALHQRKSSLKLLDGLLTFYEAAHALTVTAVHHLHESSDTLLVF